MFMTFIHKSGGDGGEVTGEKTAKPTTTVQYWVPTFVSGNQLDIFKKESSAEFLALFVQTKAHM